MQSAFEELKKYEMARAGAARRAREKRARSERLAEDDLGIELHRRREEG